MFLRRLDPESRQGHPLWILTSNRVAERTQWWLMRTAAASNLETSMGSRGDRCACVCDLRFTTGCPSDGGARLYDKHLTITRVIHKLRAWPPHHPRPPLQYAGVGYRRVSACCSPRVPPITAHASSVTPTVSPIKRSPCCSTNSSQSQFLVATPTSAACVARSDRRQRCLSKDSAGSESSQ